MTYLTECCLSAESKIDRGLQRKNAISKYFVLCICIWSSDVYLWFSFTQQNPLALDICSFCYSVLNMFVNDLTTQNVHMAFCRVISEYTYASLNDGDTFWEMRR